MNGEELRFLLLVVAVTIISMLIGVAVRFLNRERDRHPPVRK